MWMPGPLSAPSRAAQALTSAAIWSTRALVALCRSMLNFTWPGIALRLFGNTCTTPMLPM